MYEYIKPKQKQGVVKPTKIMCGLPLSSNSYFKEGSNTIQHVQKIRTDAGVSVAQNYCVQLKRVEISIQGLTHMVRKKGSSIFNGQEIPPPFGQLVQDDRLVIDNEKFEMSRRGIHQEDDLKRQQDEVGQADKKWFKILKVKGVETDDKDFYIREGTFSQEKEQTDSDIVSVDEIKNLLNNILPMWANIHRALELEVEEFKILEKKEPHPSLSTAEKVKQYANAKDDVVIADLLCGISPGGKRLHLGSMKAEKVGEDKQICARVYLTIISEQQVDRTDPDIPYTKYKDIQHDEVDEKVQIYGVEKAGSPKKDNRPQVIFFNIGKPARAYGWVEKYIQQEAKKNSTVNPVVRSFLVPLNDLTDMLSNASNEHEKNSSAVANADFDRAGNQFAMQKEGLQLLQDKAVPGSLITYTDGIDALDKTSGKICSLSVLREETGIPDIKIKNATLEGDDPKNPGFRPVSLIKEGAPELNGKEPNIKDKIINDSKKKRPSSMVADELQNYYAHWTGKKALLTEPNEEKQRTVQVKSFLEQQYITNSKYSQTTIQEIKKNIETVLKTIKDTF